MNKGTIVVRTGDWSDTPQFHVIPRAELRHVVIDCPYSQFGEGYTKGEAYWLVNYQLVNQPPRSIFIGGGENSPQMELRRKANAHRLFDVITNVDRRLANEDANLVITEDGHIKHAYGALL